MGESQTIADLTLTASDDAGGNGQGNHWGLWLVFEAGHPVSPRFVPLTSERLILGRKPGPEGLAFPDDRRQSRQHAALTRQDGMLWLHDLDSRNGTMVDGDRIRRVSLRDGSILRLGTTVLVLRSRPQQPEDRSLTGLLGVSEAMRQLRLAVDRAAPTTASVLLTGQSGTGKTVASRALHEQSGRPGAFVPVNCAALPEALVESLLFGHRAGAFTGAQRSEPGLFRSADRGTLFLDEVGELPLSLQPKLLRALEEGEVLPVGASRPVPVDVRIVAATNVRLVNAVKEGRFRGDLYTRLAQLVVALPPLQERREDLGLLLGHLLSEPRPLASDLLDALFRWHWPYNVRELANLATELSVHGADQESWGLELVARRFEGAQRPGTPRTSERPDVATLTRLLARHSGNVSALARELGSHRKQVYRWLERAELDPAAFREEG